MDKQVGKLSNLSLQTFGCRGELDHSIETWCTLICQAWLKGFLNRLLVVGSGHNMKTDIAFATYTVADAGSELLKNVELQEILLPAMDNKWLLVTDIEYKLI